ncbi:MAG: FHA domain-containing protein [Myxococcaceae bacterium]|nr:FHA domain-containing protein [Myxococcaceae bacterium]
MKGWIRDAAGVRTPLTTKGVLIGRSSACTVVLDEPSISRHHVLLLLANEAVLVLPLGKKGVVVRDEPCVVATTANHGDVLGIGRAQFTFELEREQAASPWLLSVGGVRYPISKPVFTLGGDAGDDLVISAWPAHAATLHAVSQGQGLVLDLGEPCDVTGAIAQGEGFALRRGSRISRQGVDVEIVEAPPSVDTYDDATLPSEVVLEFVPDGALLRLQLSGEFTVYLPQKRADLVAALLKPPTGIVPGEWVDDEVLSRRVWGSQSASRNQVNVLIHRTRCSLTEAGLNGPALIERAPGGGATRFRVASARRVTVL